MNFLKRYFSNGILRTNSLNFKLNPRQITVITEIFNAKLSEKCKTLLSRRQFEEEEVELRTNLSLLDLSAFLQSTIAFNSAQRQGQLSTLSALLQQTLDSVREGLNDLRGDLQASGNTVHSLAHRQQRLEGELQRREGALGVALGEFRTKSEAVKLRAIYFFTMGIAGLFLAIVIESSRKRRDRAAKEKKNKEIDREFNNF